MNDNDGALAVMIIGQLGGGFASGSDPLADLVRVATSAVIRSRQMKSTGPAGLVQKIHTERVDEGTLHKPCWWRRRRKSA